MAEKTSLHISFRLWENGRVPYTIDAAFLQSERDVIAASIAAIEAVSCVTWVAREPTDVNYVRIHKESDGCFATVGSFPTSIMNLGTGCLVNQNKHYKRIGNNITAMIPSHLRLPAPS